MSVHIIIDGYNLALQSDEFGSFSGNDLQTGREKLIKALAAYKKIKRHRITVVYDGTKYPSFSRHKEFISGIEVIFSRQGEIADSVIKRIVDIEKKFPHIWTLRKKSHFPRFNILPDVMYIFVLITHLFSQQFLR